MVTMGLRHRACIHLSGGWTAAEHLWKTRNEATTMMERVAEGARIEGSLAGVRNRGFLGSLPSGLAEEFIAAATPI